jgi:hypothetical protein
MIAPPPDSRSTLERWLALLVRYWAFNMSLAYARTSWYPGFGYTPDEKSQMRGISQKFSFGQYVVWVLLVVAIALPILAIIGTVGLYPVIHGTNPTTMPASVFFLSFVPVIVAAFTIGLPAAMLLSAALVGRWYKVTDSDLPDRATTAHFFHKLWFQLMRISILMMVVLVPLWILVPDNSKFWAAERLVLPILGPAVTVLFAVYYFSARLKRKA